MQIESVKPWQWAVAGVIAGLLFSAVHAFAGPWFTAESLGTILQGEFEHHLLGQVNGGWRYARRFHAGQPAVKDVVVHPPIYGDESHQYWVTGKAYSIGLQHRDPSDVKSPMVVVEHWTPFKYPAAAPYVGASGAAGTYPTVSAYLARTKASPAAKFDYRFAWQETPIALWTLPSLAGLLMIGVAWPVALGAMANFGVVPPPKAKPAARQVSPPPTPMPRPVASKPAVRLAPPPPAPEPVPVEDGRRYGGEFYPVVKKAQHD